MKKIIFKLFPVLLILSVLLPAVPAAHAEAGKTDGRSLRIVSDMGAHDEFPENSVEAVLLAAEQGADEVRLPVKLTADGEAILCEDDNLERICGTEPVPVSSLTADEVAQLRVRKGSGGAAEFTEGRVPLLSEVLKAAKGKIRCLLDFDFAIRDRVYNTVKEAGALGDCDLVLRASAKKAQSWAAGLEQAPTYLIYRKTNVIFTALSVLSAAEKNGCGVFLASSNPYGVIYGSALGKRLPGAACAAVRISRKELSGKRADTPDYWENLIDAGYNMLITDDAALMAQYREQSLDALRELREYTGRIEADFRLEDLRSPSYRKMKFAFGNAMSEAQRLCGKAFAGRNECENALYALKNAVNDIESNHERILNGEADLRLTPGRIVTAVLTVAAFAALEIFIAKKRGAAKKK